MPIILLSINHPKESVSIKQFLIKNNIQIVTCLATYSSYIKGLQYGPDLVVSEFTEKAKKEYFSFLKAKCNNPIIKPVPFICYGDECDTQSMTTLKEYGIDVYIKRPLNPQILIAILTKILSAKANGNAPSTENKKVFTPKDDDIRKLKDRAVSLEEKLLIMRNHITRLLAFPVTIANILRVTQNESSGANDLALIIKTDPAVSAEILKAANSVHFSRGGARISGMKDAIVRIGFMESRKLALSLSVFKLKQHSNFTTGFDHIEFWFHSLAVGIIAERLARNSQLVNPEEAFIGGLLHDIGLLLMNEFFNPLFLEILDQSISESKQFIMCEAIKIGFTHNHFMRVLFTEWNFPQSLIAAVPFFSRTDIFKKESLVKIPLAVIITLAEQIARNLSIGGDVDNIVQPIPQEILHMLKLPYGLQKNVIENIFTSLNTYNQVLKIDSRTFPYEPPADYISPKILYFNLTENIYNPVYDYCLYRKYAITETRVQSDCIEKVADYDIIILNGITGQHLDFVQKLSLIKRPSPKNETPASNETNVQEELVPIKMILFSQDTTLNSSQINSDTVLLLSYPIDLRSIDAVISCYANNTSPREFSNDKPVETKVVQETIKSASIAVIHSNQQYRSRLNSVLTKISGISISEIDPSTDLKKLLTVPFKSIFLEFSSTSQVIETYERFKQGSSSKPQFVIVFKTLKKEDVHPLISVGITLFISESDDDESIEKRIFTILTTQNK
jgi:HD-like signal output (HDOD) protein/DNA-binding NarL/FixJ family response regulator